MNLEYFIAKRLSGAASYKSNASATIIKIAIAAIALSMIMMIVAVGTGLGLKYTIREKVAAFNGHILVSNFDGNNSLETVNPVSLQQDFYPDFETVPEVNHVQGIAIKGGFIRSETDFEGVLVKGLGADYDWSRIEEYIVEGRKPDFTGDLNTEMLISSYLANRLGFSLGDKVVVYFTREGGRLTPLRLDIVGVYASAYQEFDKVFLLGDIRHVQRINRWSEGEVGAFEIFIDDFDTIDPVTNAVYENTGSTLQAISVTQNNPFIYQWINTFDFNIALIITLLIIIAGLNIIVALIVLILDRTRMIGVLKALGSANWNIQKIFLYNAAHLIGRGLLWGNVIGIGLLLLQHKFGLITLDPVTYYVSEAPVLLDPMKFLLLNLGVFILCLAMLVIPSYIITRISPVKTMKFE